MSSLCTHLLRYVDGIKHWNHVCSSSRETLRNQHNSRKSEWGYWVHFCLERKDPVMSTNISQFSLNCLISLRRFFRWVYSPRKWHIRDECSLYIQTRSPWECRSHTNNTVRRERKKYPYLLLQKTQSPDRYSAMIHAPDGRRIQV